MKLRIRMICRHSWIPLVGKLSSLALLFLFTCHVSLALGQKKMTSAEISEDPMMSRVTLEPFVRFYSIGALIPHASAGRFILTPDILDEWAELKPRIEDLAGAKENGRAADATILLACAKWLFDSDTRRAVSMANSVIEDYPMATSVLSINPYDQICPVRLDMNWHIYIQTLMRGENADSAILSKRERVEAISRETYVAHMRQYPVLAADVAGLFMYLISESHRTTPAGEKILKDILYRHPYDQMRRAKEADKETAINEHCPDLMSLMRPEVAAGLHLMRHHEALGDAEQAIEVGQSLVNAVSSDGFYWQINKALGDLYLDDMEEGPSPDAERQYRVALDGYLTEIRQKASRKAESGDTRGLPLEAWESTIKEFKKSISEAGGVIVIDAEELRAIIPPPEGEDTTSLTDSPILKQLKEIRSRKGLLAEPVKRQAATTELKDTFLNQVKRSSADEEKDLLQQRVVLAVGLAQLAGGESDAETREMILTAMREVVNAKHAKEFEKKSEIDDEMRQKVDQLILQIAGNEKIEGAVPDPLANLSDLPGSALLYASQRFQELYLSLDAKRAIVKALANGENPILYDFFVGIILGAEDEKLTRFAVRGIERIIENAEIDESGIIEVTGE